MAECLQCGDARETVKREGLICGVVSTGEYTELTDEWPRHRWVDWTDRELARFGVKPDAFDRHRRTRALDFQWIACDDLLRGHVIIREGEDVDWGKPGTCILCGSAPEPHDSGGDRG